MFAAVAIVVGTIMSMTTAGMVAAQTIDSGNNDNINTNNCQGINPASVSSDSATAAVSDSEIGGTDDADEPGDVDVNDEEDTDSGSEDAGEADDDEEEDDDGTVSTPASDNVAGSSEQVLFDSCNFSNEIVDNLYHNSGTIFIDFRQAMGGV